MCERCKRGLCGDACGGANKQNQKRTKTRLPSETVFMDQHAGGTPSPWATVHGTGRNRRFAVRRCDHGMGVFVRSGFSVRVSSPLLMEYTGHRFSEDEFGAERDTECVVSLSQSHM